MRYGHGHFEKLSQQVDIIRTQLWWFQSQGYGPVLYITPIATTTPTRYRRSIDSMTNGGGMRGVFTFCFPSKGRSMSVRFSMHDTRCLFPAGRPQAHKWSSCMARTGLRMKPIQKLSSVVR